LQELVQRYHIRRLALFGSAARGELKPDSDIDLMVEFAPGEAPSLWSAQDLQQDFVQLFGGGMWISCRRNPAQSLSPKDHRAGSEGAV